LPKRVVVVVAVVVEMGDGVVNCVADRMMGVLAAGKEGEKAFTPVEHIQITALRRTRRNFIILRLKWYGVGSVGRQYGRLLLLSIDGKWQKIKKWLQAM
jgi:hypothetical protein